MQHSYHTESTTIQAQPESNILELTKKTPKAPSGNRLLILLSLLALYLVWACLVSRLF